MASLKLGDEDFAEVPTLLPVVTYLPSIAGALVAFHHDSESNQTVFS